METAKIIYESDLRTKAIHVFSGTEILTDAPLDNNGKASAFSPTDLMSTSLACCMITIMGIRAEKSAISIGKIKADVFKTMGTDPRRVTKIKVDIYFENEFDTKEKAILEAAALNCPVAKSLHPDIIQEVSFHYGNK